MTKIHQTLFGPLDRFEDRCTNEVTFKGKLSLPIHRWYRLTPSFSPRLALDIAEHFGLGPEDYVLDPFSGVGTVPLCMKYEGIPACSIEINPYLHFVSTVKTRTYRDIANIHSRFEDFIKVANPITTELLDPPKAGQYLKEYEEIIPPIHKPDRWWSPSNLAQLVAIRNLLLNHTEPGEHFDLLRMGILGILISVSNAKHNHVSLTFADKPLPPVNVADTLRDKFDEILSDLEFVSSLPAADVRVYQGNSKEVFSILPDEPRVSAVITSPPYPNRFSYARETRPHLFFFEFIRDAKAVGQLETDAIGGTWGKATSVLTSGIRPINKYVADLLFPYTEDIKISGSLMAHYVTKYFNDMYEHAAEIAKVCRPRAKLAYVIGNSMFYGCPLPSDEILAAIFEHHGFKLDRISKMRRRQSKSGLYEAVVFMDR